MLLVGGFNAVNDAENDPPATPTQLNNEKPALSFHSRLLQ